MSKTLNLTLKKQWFDMIAAGIKKEEYREIKPHWAKRFFNFNGPVNRDSEDICVSLIKSPTWVESILKVYHAELTEFDEVYARNGYASDAPLVKWKHKGIRIGEGKPEWGAEPGKQYFILEIGELIK